MLKSLLLGLASLLIFSPGAFAGPGNFLFFPMPSNCVETKQTYNTIGSGTYTIPTYNGTLRFQIWGGGGGGGGMTGPGGNGSPSSLSQPNAFGTGVTFTANGGIGGAMMNGVATSGGAGGSGSVTGTPVTTPTMISGGQGGATASPFSSSGAGGTGGGMGGGAGGAPVSSSTGLTGMAPGGGGSGLHQSSTQVASGGGGGGYLEITFPSSTNASQNTINYTVGMGGTEGPGTTFTGGPGGIGQVIITVTNCQ